MARDEKIKKILIIRFSSIGDIVLTTPVVRCLKQQMPRATIHFCTKAQFKYLVDKNPYIDQIHLLDDSLGKLIGELQEEKFDLIIDLHDNLRTLIIKWRLGVKHHTYDKLRWQRDMLALLPIAMPKPSHVVERYMKTLDSLGISYDNKGLDFYIDDKDEVETEWLPESHQKGYVAYVMGGTAFTKMLPIEKMIELCDKINLPIVLIGGKEDFEKGEQLVRFFQEVTDDRSFNEGLLKLNKKTSIFNGCGKFNLGQSASLVKNSLVVFAHDTGFAHVAAAFKKTVYSIWGGTVPLYFYPFETRFILLENKKLSCRPCSKNGRASCPKRHFKCMKENPLEFYLPESHSGISE